MTHRDKTATKGRAKSGMVPRPYQLQSPEIARTMAQLRARYGKYASPDAKLRRLLAKAMRDKTLTKELYAMREGR